jgi:hypothetical protein
MRTRFISFLCLLLISAGIVGCQTVTMDFGGKMDRRSIDAKSHFFFWGLTSAPELDVKEYCGNGVARIVERSTPLDCLFTALTYGVYNPRTSEFFCRF